MSMGSGNGMEQAPSIVWSGDGFPGDINDDVSSAVAAEGVGSNVYGEAMSFEEMQQAGMHVVGGPAVILSGDFYYNSGGDGARRPRGVTEPEKF